jgi:hypothetical protein
MRGNWSPASISTIRVVPNGVRITTILGCSPGDPSDDTRIFPERMTLQRAQRILRR